MFEVISSKLGNRKFRREFEEFSEDRRLNVLKRLNDAGLDLRQDLISIFLKNRIYYIEPVSFDGQNKVYTPRQLEGIVNDILDYKEFMSGYMIYEDSVIHGALIDLSLPPSFKGDLMLAVQNAGVLNKSNLSKSAEILANVIFYMRNIENGRDFYSNVGAPYIDCTIGDDFARKLINEGFISDKQLSGNYLKPNVDIIFSLREKVYSINRKFANYITR